MKKLFILTVLAIALTGNVHSQTRSNRKNSLKPSQEEMLINYEKQEWEFLKQKDFKAFANRIAEDYYAIFPEGEGEDVTKPKIVTKPIIVTKPKLLKAVATVFEIKDYQFSDFRVTMLNKDAAIITYQIDERVMEKREGKEFLNHNAITSGWARRGGRWQQVFFRPFILSSTSV